MWVTVTVAFAFRARADIGFPTILLAPTIQTFLPSNSILYSSKILITPRGVQGNKPI